MTRWLGHWRLLPELSHAEGAELPRDGSLKIMQDGGTIRIEARWTDAALEDHSSGFSAPADGTPQQSGAADVDTFAVRAESDDVLSGEARRHGRRVGWAMRRVSANGRLMSVVQGRDFPDGPQDLVFLVYKREQRDA